MTIHAVGQGFGYRPAQLEPFAKGVTGSATVLGAHARTVKVSPELEKLVDDLHDGNSGGAYAWDLSPQALSKLLLPENRDRFLYRLLAGGDMVSYFPMEDVSVEPLPRGKAFTAVRNLFIEEEFMDDLEPAEKRRVEQGTRRLLHSFLAEPDTQVFRITAGDTGVGWYEGVFAINVRKGEVRELMYVNPP